MSSQASEDALKAIYSKICCVRFASNQVSVHDGKQGQKPAEAQDKTWLELCSLLLLSLKRIASKPGAGEESGPTKKKVMIHEPISSFCCNKLKMPSKGKLSVLGLGFCYFGIIKLRFLQCIISRPKLNYVTKSKFQIGQIIHCAIQSVRPRPLFGSTPSLSNTCIYFSIQLQKTAGQQTFKPSSIL